MTRRQSNSHAHRRARVAAFVVGAALIPAGAAGTVRAQEYPAKPVRLIVQSPPGGGADFLARVLGRQLAESWGQTVVIDNRPGAGGAIGTAMVAHAPPDGYTLLLVPSTHAISPSFYKKLPYEPIKDFAPVAQIATSSNVVVVHPSLPVRSVAELIALAKRRPGELSYGSAGIGATTHLSGELFRSLAGIRVVHVPYKGSGPAEIDLAGGHLQFMVDTMPAALPNVRSGKTRALATTGRERAASLPELPVVAESGLPGYEFTTWWGVSAPSGTPPAIVAKLNKEIVRIMAQAEIRELTLTQGTEPRTGTPQEFADYIKSQIEFFAKIVASAGIKPE
ncbi:MAG TPA: tripartite tricarboxylate transporter substrate binding protein [Burkholderiales bacterium]|nr:tripartite tricarboxylate transporter substrate binding protein [Burkholderiales bacterium]